MSPKLFITTLLLIACVKPGFSQAVKSESENKQEVKIDLDKKTVFVQLQVSKDKIELDKLPTALYLIFPDKEPEKIKLGFNDPKAKIGNDDAYFTIGFQNKDSLGVDIAMSDIRFGMVKLTFEKESQLIAVNDRLLEKPKKIVLDANGKPVIEFKPTKKTEEKPVKDKWAKPDGTQVMIPMNETELNELKANWEATCPECNDFFKPENKEETSCCKDPIPFPYNQRYSIPCASECEHGNDVTHEYEIIIDQRPGASRPVTYLRMKNRKGYEYYKVRKRINPIVERDVLVHVIGHQDSLYTFENSETLDFMDYADEVSGIFKPKEEEEESTSENEPEKDTDSGNKTKPIIGSQPETKEVAEMFEESTPDFLNFLESYDLNLNREDKLKLFTKLIESNFAADLQKQLAKSADFERKIDSLHAELQKLKTVFTDKMKADSVQIDSLKKIIREKESLITAYINTTYDSLAREQKAGLSLIYEKFIELNRKISSHETTESIIMNELECISKFMIQHLYVAMSADPETLEKRLRQAVENDASQKYYADFKSLISQIRSEYEKVNARTNKYRHFTCQLSTPNADLMGIKVKTKSDKTIFDRELRTSLGLKIDFSTGIIYSALDRPDFVLANETMRYKVTRDSIADDGSVITEYTGEIRDTTGQVIMKNPKSGFNSGFLIHAYTRSGTSTNIALTTGVILNNSDIQYMLGGSVLFAMNGEHRIALSGGVVWGKETKLSNDLTKFERHPDDNAVYANRYALKPYYTGDANINNSTYEKYNHSFFIALTVNLGTVNVK